MPTACEYKQFGDMLSDRALEHHRVDWSAWNTTDKDIKQETR